MKIVIDIPEEQKKMVDMLLDLPPQVENDLISAIRHGTPTTDIVSEIKELAKFHSEDVPCVYGDGEQTTEKYVDLVELGRILWEVLENEEEDTRDCDKCAYYCGGANDEACDGCFAEEYEHPNFKSRGIER